MLRRGLFFLCVLALACVGAAGSAAARERFPAAYRSEGMLGGQSLQEGAYSRWRGEAVHLKLEDGRDWIALDLGREMPINRLRWRKHFWPMRSPSDLDVEVCSDDLDRDGNGTWRKVAEVRGNTHRLGTTVMFETTRARFIRVTVLECYGKPDPWNLADINQIEVGLARETAVSGLSVSAEPGRNVLHWRDPRPRGAENAAPRADEGGDTICWRSVPADGYFKVYRGTNPEDGYRVLNLAGPVVRPEFVDDTVAEGMEYRYRVTWTDRWEGPPSEPVSTRAKPHPPVSVLEPGLAALSSGRFGLDANLYKYDAVEGHGSFAGFAVGLNERVPYLVYPSIRRTGPWPEGFAIEGSKVNRSLQGCLVFGAVGPAQPSRPMRIVYSGWDGMEYELGEPGDRLRVVHSALSPAVVFRFDAARVRLFGDMGRFGSPLPARVAFATAQGIRDRSLEETVDLADMSESWLLLWWGDNVLAPEVDIPWLVRFQRRPETISANASGVSVGFPGAAEDVALMPLYGVAKVSTADWAAGLPDDVVRRARRWSARLVNAPTRCHDTFSLDPDSGGVRVQLRYEYRTSTDDWDTKAVALAPVPPSFALAASKGLPVAFPQAVSQEFAAFNGPLFAAENTDRVSLTMPALLDVIENPFERKTARPDRLEYVRSILPIEENIAFLLNRKSSPSKWRTRGLELRMGPMLAGYHWMSKAARESVRTIFRRHLQDNRYFDLDTYYAVEDRYSMRKYILADDPDQTVAHSVDYAYGAGGTLWCLYEYARTTGDWDLIRKHWESVLQFGTVFAAGNAWNHPSPDAMTFYNEWGGNPDYLGTYYHGLLALARMADKVGDKRTYRRAVYMFARNLVSLVMYWHIQSWAYDHRPWHCGGGREPEAGYTYAGAVTGEGVIGIPTNSKSELKASLFYPFVTITGDYARFLDRYLRDAVAKYCYQDLRAVSPNRLNGHLLLARGYLFDNDPRTLREWIDRTYLAQGDYAATNPYALFGLMVNQAPVTLRPADPKWMDPAYEKRIRGLDRPRRIRSLDEATPDEAGSRQFRVLWEIGKRDNSGKEFTKASVCQDLVRTIAEETGKPAGLVRRELRGNPTLGLESLEKTEGKPFVVGKTSTKEWRYAHDGAWVPGGMFRRKGEAHPRTIEFAWDPGEPGEPALIVDIQSLDAMYPLFYTMEINGHVAGVRCPLPFYFMHADPIWFRRSVTESDGGEAVIEFPVPREWLRPGENRITVRVEGARRIYYDWIGFGVFSQRRDGSSMRPMRP